MKFHRLASAAVAAGAAVGATVVTPLMPTASASGVIPLLRVGTDFSIPTLNPTKPTYDGDIDGLALETLLTLGRGDSLQPNLATSWQQTSPVTYVYHLRHGVTFWDGDEMAAADVAFSWNYYRSPGSFADSDFVAGIKSIAADGPYTVVVTLDQPYAAWKYVPAELPGVFEEKFFEAHSATFGDPGTLIMGTGPWEVDSFDPTTGAQLSANPHWWGGSVPIQHISVSIFTNETSLQLAMRAGDIDLDPYVLDTKTFASTSEAKMLSTITETNANFAMDTHTPGFNDVHVRRAVAYALNRADIIASAGGYNEPIYTFYPPVLLDSLASPGQVSALLNSLPLYKYNLAAAKAEMAQSAYPNGFSTTLYEYNYGTSVATSEVVASELAKIGIRAKVVVAPTLAAWGAVQTGPLLQRPSYFATGWCGGPDISSCDFPLGSWNNAPGERNTANWAPSDVDTWLKQGLTTSEDTQRFATYSKILRAIQADVPYIGLYQEGVSIALSSKFTVPGYTSDPNLMSGDYALNVKLAG